MKKNTKINIYVYLCLLSFFIVSIVSIFSAQSIVSKLYNSFYIKQLVWYIVGILFFILTIKVSNEKILRHSTLIYITSIVLLILVLLIGNEINNTKGWISIGSLSFQPSEFAKLGLILMISKVLNEFHFKSHKNFKEELILISKILLITAIPSFLTFIEPDTGSVIIYFVIAFIMTFVSGLKKGWFLIFFFIAFFALGTLIYIYLTNSELFIRLFSSDFYYRIHRLIDWSNTSGMQLEHSLIAIGSAGLFGHGFNRTPIYFPEPYTDFIFTVFTSNFGVIAAINLIIIIVLFNFFIINIALKNKKTINKYIIAGIIASFVYSQIQNIAMTIGIIPITGITLPFISYGGSSLIISFIMIGLIINVYNEKDWF